MVVVVNMPVTMSNRIIASFCPEVAESIMFEMLGNVATVDSTCSFCSWVDFMHCGTWNKCLCGLRNKGLGFVIPVHHDLRRKRQQTNLQSVRKVDDP